ncbi:MAG: hypothetical protein RMJ28_06990 [Nitrososphaerota archaeon]|nr:hypothetical protein [Candidatus Calditenuaceae archaeon]MDW8073959.1 hypothetical protein [Nitrososphaerota archaeon]
MNRELLPYLLAERFGWTHEDIMRMTRAEALYYAAAARLAEREAERAAKRSRKRR